MAFVQGEERSTLAPKPPTVSSTSSMDTCFDTNVTGALEIKKEGGIQAQNIVLNNNPLTQTAVAPILPATDAPSLKSVNHSSWATTSSGSLDQMSSSVPLMARTNQLHISPTTGVTVPEMPITNTVPEFLYQLTRMLTDNNRDVIEWSNGKIEVHNPNKLQTNVLNRYFRHSKFASFQRQLNYFGFRKLAGKGKMAPCSYVNDATANELGSLLLIKRKIGNEPKANGGKKRDRDEGLTIRDATQSKASSSAPVNPVLAGILHRSSDQNNTFSPSGMTYANLSSQKTGTSLSSSMNPPQSQQALARVAVGKGIKHSFSLPQQNSAVKLPPLVVPNTSNSSVAESTQASLSALQSNFQNSLQDSQSQGAESTTQARDAYNNQESETSSGFIPGTLRRDDSLVDLAMIPMLDDSDPIQDIEGSHGLTFVDFPWQDPTSNSDSV